MSYLQTEIISHGRRVCSLYKRSLRNLESWLPERHIYRYRAVLLRQRFEEHRNEKNMMVAEQLVRAGEEELFQTQHYHPIKFPNSPGGVAYGREAKVPDWVLDFWHPDEKAMYPEYFARREQRKKEYIALWEKLHGKAEEAKHH